MFNLVLRASVTFVQQSGKRRAVTGSNHFEITKEITEFHPTGLTAQSEALHTPEMVVPRAHVFRPLGTRSVPSFHAARSANRLFFGDDAKRKREEPSPPTSVSAQHLLLGPSICGQN